MEVGELRVNWWMKSFDLNYFESLVISVIANFKVNSALLDFICFFAISKLIRHIVRLYVSHIAGMAVSYLHII